MTRAPVNPKVLQWACERSGIAHEELEKKFKKLPAWEKGEAQPTMKQAKDFAKAVYVPFSYLFLSKPPEEPLPISDFRTIGNSKKKVERPSPNLLDMIYICQERQDWYQEFVRVSGESAISFVGSVTTRTSPKKVATTMRGTLGFDVKDRRQASTWTDALRLFIKQAEDAGVLVMKSGIVMSNTRRLLDPQEFRGFALSDPFAPLVFINSADTMAAHMFTLAHELAHLWLGKSGLSNIKIVPGKGFQDEEVWCNAVAAELLVPLDLLHKEIRIDEPLDNALSRLAESFKVSNLVILRRLLDAKQINRSDFNAKWETESERLRNLSQRNKGGGNFYRTTMSRVGRRFTSALVVSTLEGQTLYRDAFHMLGVSNTKTFNGLAREAKVIE